MPHVYLLHFDKKVADHAQHYCGWTPNGVESRLAKHLKGNGAKLVKEAVRIGCEVTVVRVWEHEDCHSARVQERRMKNTGHLPSYCPVCCGREA